MPCPTNYFYHFTLRFIESSKPNPNQISTSNGKSGTVNGAVGTTFQPQNTLLGRACESCYGESVQRRCLLGGGAVLHRGGGQRKAGGETLLEVMLLLHRGRWYLFKVSGCLSWSPTGSKGAFAGYLCTTQIRTVCICSGFLCGLCVCWQVLLFSF